MKLIDYASCIQTHYKLRRERFSIMKQSRLRRSLNLKSEIITIGGFLNFMHLPKTLNKYSETLLYEFFFKYERLFKKFYSIKDIS